MRDGSIAIQWIPAGIAGTRVREVVGLSSATQRRFVVELEVDYVIQSQLGFKVSYGWHIRKNVIYILTPQNLKYIYRIACINKNYMRKDQ